MTKRLHRGWSWVVLAGFVSAMAGCQVAGVISDRASAPTVKAKYIPAQDPMLVLVEHYHVMLDSEIEPQHLQAALEKAMRDNHVAPVIDEDRLERLRDADFEAYDKMTIDGVGRAVGARQVMYVNITNADIQQPSGSDQIRGRMTAMVQIVDSGTGDDRWDPTSVSIETTWARAEDATADDVRTRMADQMAQDIAKLFYDHPQEKGVEEKASAE